MAIVLLCSTIVFNGETLGKMWVQHQCTMPHKGAALTIAFADTLSKDFGSKCHIGEIVFRASKNMRNHFEKVIRHALRPRPLPMLQASTPERQDGEDSDDEED